MSELPKCGLYRTTREHDGVPAGALVYFHDHGEPGPGVYLPSGWSANRAQWHSHGTTVDAAYAATLEPLAAEGLYRVREPFHCCEKQCRLFETDLLVQLGYDGAGQALLFVPEWTAHGLAVPERGNLLARGLMSRLAALKTAEAADAPKRQHQELN